MSLTKAIIITTNESGIYAINKVGSDSLPEITIKQVNQLVQVAKSKPLIFDDLDEGDIKQLLRDFDMAFVLPITVKSTQLGLLMLGEKSSGKSSITETFRSSKFFAPIVSCNQQRPLVQKKFRNLT